MRVIGNTRHITLRLPDLVLIHAGLGVGDVTERDIRGITLDRLADRDIELATLRTLRHRSIVFACQRELECTVLRPRDARQLLRQTQIRRRHRHRIRLVDIGEVTFGHSCLGLKLALAVVGHLHGHGGGVAIVSDSGHITLRLPDRVPVCADLVVADRTEVELRRITVGGLANGDRRVLRHRCALGRFDREVERAVLRPRDTRQLLRERRLHAGRDAIEWLGGVLVDERAFRHVDLRNQIALLVVGHRHRHLGRVRVIGNTGHIALRLSDRVLIHAGLSVDDVTEREVRLGALIRLAHRLRQHAILRTFRHRSTVRSFERELELAVLRPRDAGQLLGEPHLSGTDRHLLRIIGVREHTISHFGLGDEIALLVVLDRDGHLSGVLRIRDAGHVPGDLGHRVLVLAFGRIRDCAEIEGCGITVGRLADRDVELAVLRTLRHRGIAISRKRELERTVRRPINAGQLLDERHTLRHATRRLRTIHIDKRAISDDSRRLKLALAIVTDRDLHRGRVTVVGHTGHITLRLLDRVLVGARLVVTD